MSASLFESQDGERILGAVYVCVLGKVFGDGGVCEQEGSNIQMYMDNIWSSLLAYVVNSSCIYISLCFIFQKFMDSLYLILMNEEQIYYVSMHLYCYDS